MKLKKTKKRIKLIFILHIVLLLLAYSIYLNKYITPNLFPYSGIIPLGFPVLFLFYFLLTALWIVLKRKRSLFFIVLGIPLFFSLSNIVYFPIKETQKEKVDLKVMSFNVQYAFKGIRDLENYIYKNNVDIVFLQEIYKRHWRKEAFLPNRFNAVHDFVGISSSHPIVFDKAIPLPETNGHSCLADIVMGTDTIRAINIYLEPIYINKDLIKFKDTEDFEEKTGILKNKLATGTKIHHKQLNILKEFIIDSPYPVVVGGDFNSVPNTYEYYTISKILNDAFTISGKGLATTFHDYYYPIRIDYIFSDAYFKAQSFKVDRNFEYSDHYPIFAEFSFMKKIPIHPQ